MRLIGAIMIALLGTLVLTGCRAPTASDLAARTPSAVYLDSSGQMSVPPDASRFSRSLDLPKNLQERSEPRAWVRYDLPRDATYAYAQDCRNIVGVYQDQKLLMGSDTEASYPSLFRLFVRQPFFPLDHKGGSLYLRTFYTMASEYHPACQSLLVGTRDRILWHYLTAHSATLITAIITIFLGLDGLILTVFSFGRALFYFSSFALAMGMALISAAELPELVFGPGPHWTHFWHFSYIFVAIPFFLFFDAVVAAPYKIVRKMAVLNFALFIGIISAFLFMESLDLEIVRQYIGLLYLIEGLIFMASIIHAMVSRVPHSRLYGFAILIYLVAIMLDIYGGLIRQSYTQLGSWFFLLFETFCIVSLIVIKMQDDGKAERDKAIWIQERNRRLQLEVEKRIEALGKRSLELEAAHVELEERLELLMGQKRKVADLAQEQDNLLNRIAGIHQLHLPNLVSKLQNLHEGIDPYQIRKVGETIGEISRVLDPLAQLYRARSVGKHRRIVALCANKKLQRTLRIALGGSKLDFRMAETGEEFRELLHSQMPDMMVLDETSADRVADFHERNPKATIVMLTEGDAVKGLSYLNQNTMLDQAFGMQLPKSILHKMLMTHFSKFINRDLFGIEKYLMWGSVVKERPLLSRGSQANVLTAVKKDLDAWNLSSIVYPKVLNICELFLHLSETGQLAKQEDEKSIRQLRFGYDANLVAISLDISGQLLSRREILDMLVRDKAILHDLSRMSHAIILNSDSAGRHELIAMLYEGHQPEGPAFFYPFLAS